MFHFFPSLQMFHGDPYWLRCLSGPRSSPTWRRTTVSCCSWPRHRPTWTVGWPGKVDPVASRPHDAFCWDFCRCVRSEPRSPGCSSRRSVPDDGHRMSSERLPVGCTQKPVPHSNHRSMCRGELVNTFCSIIGIDHQWCVSIRYHSLQLISHIKWVHNINGNVRHILPYDVHDIKYIDISITTCTIQLYSGYLSGHTVRHLAVVQYTTVS